jgi:hypothetical protein
MDENEQSAPLDDEQQTEKDVSYSPSSERETAEKQEESEGEARVRPGTGGPDDSGDLDADPADLHMPDRGDPE